MNNLAQKYSIKIARVIGFSSPLGAGLLFAKSVFAQAATAGASKGGTGSSLPNAGSTELTYLLFLGGMVLFVFGTLKLILSYRD